MKKVFLAVAVTVLLCSGCGDASTTVSSSVSGSSVSGSLTGDWSEGGRQYKKYPYCNDDNVYVDTGAGVQQWRLDGTYVAAPLKRGELLFVNNEELLYSKYRSGNNGDQICEIWSVPIKKTKGDDQLLTDQEKRILTVADGEYEDDVAKLYADGKYVVYMTNGHEFCVYDRTEGKFIPIKNDPAANHGFTNGAVSALTNVSSRYAVFNTKPLKSHYDPPYGFSLYKLGDDKVKRIDDQCYTAAPYLLDPEREQVYYQRLDDETIWGYDCNTGKKEEVLSEKKLRRCCEEQGIEWKEISIDEFYLDEGFLYLTDYDNNNVFRCRPDGKSEVVYEREVSEKLRQITRDSGALKEVSEIRFMIMEHKVLYYVSYEDDEKTKYYCVDMDTHEIKEVTEKDPEKVLFACIGWWWQY